MRDRATARGTGEEQRIQHEGERADAEDRADDQRDHVRAHESSRTAASRRAISSGVASAAAAARDAVAAVADGPRSAESMTASTSAPIAMRDSRQDVAEQIESRPLAAP